MRALYVICHIFTAILQLSESASEVSRLLDASDVVQGTGQECKTQLLTNQVFHKVGTTTALVLSRDGHLHSRCWLQEGPACPFSLRDTPSIPATRILMVCFARPDLGPWFHTGVRTLVLRYVRLAGFEASRCMNMIAFEVAILPPFLKVIAFFLSLNQ